MEQVTLSSKYQVVILKVIRKSMKLNAGQKLEVVEYDGRIELIPARDISELRGFVRGINTDFDREDDRL
ncbi:AbrB/MazE/SpoVT family DNA-binding domain-containing protein [Myxococcota bacterium]|nr:AbrB/MazE/SpoVT family DNA-binding domain-containing protein [Myxococcota bacterium]